MKGYLLDTNVVSELRKGKRANPKVLAWFQTISDEELFLSVLVLGEIRPALSECVLLTPHRRVLWSVG